MGEAGRTVSVRVALGEKDRTGHVGSEHAGQGHQPRSVAGLQSLEKCQDTDAPLERAERKRAKLTPWREPRESHV